MIWIVMIALIDILSACAVCYGDPDEPAVKAVQAGIWVLLGVIMFVLSSIGLFMYNLAKKSQES
ncbi:MAG: hypothetical protein CMG54_01310 [Candidatus Marinimicrobia bacterium]|nr:hypothetical protein [Candidatus Neomarinimicrobiota bacterium]|tara:strand:- start:2159 stop:2350 length:192 start_codon:yes stop_codon:yes gene_type:complete